MEFRQPSENLRIYADKLRASDNLSRSKIYEWFRTAVRDDIDGSGSSTTSRSSRVVAENIIAMVIRPVISAEDAGHNDLPGDDPWEIAPEYLFDSREWQWGSENTRTLANRNQIPPVLELTLVAVHEKSFRSYQVRKGNQARQDIENLLAGRFLKAADLEEDLAILSKGLHDLDIEYRVFQASVGLRTAKWSD